tara:strand:- start:1291 stop:1740 length:450 start_codon:yes stop_codon:yes gene_type:complete
MPSYCSISEAWGNEFNLNNSNKKKKSIQNNDNTAPSDPDHDSYMKFDEIIEKKESFINSKELMELSKKSESNISQPKCGDQEYCKKLLNEVLQCKECQQLIYDNIKENYAQNSLNISNNDILNSVLIGFFIILILDLFVKIGKLYQSKL